MIKLTGLAGNELFVNHEVIRTIESTPDTMICFVDGTRLPVLEKPDEIVRRMIAFKRLSTDGISKECN